jgi:hypothetical protein
LIYRNESLKDISKLTFENEKVANSIFSIEEYLNRVSDIILIAGKHDAVIFILLKYTWYFKTGNPGALDGSFIFSYKNNWKRIKDLNDKFFEFIPKDLREDFLWIMNEF